MDKKHPDHLGRARTSIWSHAGLTVREREAPNVVRMGTNAKAYQHIGGGHGGKVTVEGEHDDRGQALLGSTHPAFHGAAMAQSQGELFSSMFWSGGKWYSRF